MTQTKIDPFGAYATFKAGDKEVGIYRIAKLEEAGLTKIDRLPYSIRVLLESVLRNCDGFSVHEEDVKNLAAWNAAGFEPTEIPFKPARVVLQDFTGVPAVVDLAAMRTAMQRLGGDPAKINPLIPVDLTIDHSVQTDFFATADSAEKNLEIEFQRNNERYELLSWAQKAFDNFRVIPPAVGIIHQVNLEYLAKGVFVRDDLRGRPVALPDSLVGTDSHTTMINGLGVVGWGVGGIEAEAVMLGQPLYMLMPEVIGFEMTGKLPAGVTATDLVLRVVQLLRKEGVVGKFVEYFGEGVQKMTLADRATVANMGPEYGATMGFFPVDDETLAYLRQTGRTAEEVELLERYTKEQNLFRTADAPTPEYTKVLHLDLNTIEPSLAGPKRPQDRIALSAMKEEFNKTLRGPLNERGFALDEEAIQKTATVTPAEGEPYEIGHGTVAIASITSCTNTSNPSVMLAAGLVAKKAVERGLKVPPFVKTSLGPGSRVVTDYLDEAQLTEPLDQLGFSTVGYGCLTCIGNSGPLPSEVGDAITAGDLVATSVLSGNRNFEGRVNPLVKANYLASPPLVVAFALAGTTDIDLTTEPIGNDRDGKPVMLSEIWPTDEEVEKLLVGAVRPEMFQNQYGNVFESNPLWNAIPSTDDQLFDWKPDSTYIQEPPFMVDLSPEPEPIRPIEGARVLVALGDSVTTDHISPAGAITPDGPAGRYLQQQGVEPVDFNSFGSRRGNDRVMTRGTFANIRIRNQLVPEIEGGMTRLIPDGGVMSIYDAAIEYAEQKTPLIVLAGAEYGTGSSRDWAAKGTQLLGVRAVIASSFERIHRSNLVGMGVLPLQLDQGLTWQALGLTGEETFTIEGLDDNLAPSQRLSIKAFCDDGSYSTFEATVRIDTPVEMEYYRNGGILQTVLRKL
jgi:aconitate hydratase A / 2-methylisocitrate dehydratase